MKCASMTIGGALLALLLATAAPAKVVVGQAAPPFSARTFTNEKVTLDQLKGQVVIVNFWATWCGPCKIELPLLDAYYRIQKKYGLAVVAVTTEDSAPAYKLIPLSKAVSFTMAWHFSGAGYGSPDQYPTSFVIDRKGVVRAIQIGAFDLNGLNDTLTPLLSEAGPPAQPSGSAAAP